MKEREIHLLIWKWFGHMASVVRRMAFGRHSRIHSKIHFPTFVVIERDAPWSRRNAATSSCPSRAERWSGVYPEVVAAFGDAPCCNSCCTISAFPSRAEMCSGVWSSLSARQKKQDWLVEKTMVTLWIIQKTLLGIRGYLQCLSSNLLV